MRILVFLLLFCIDVAVSDATQSQNEMIITIQSFIKDKFMEAYKPYDIAISSIEVSPAIPANLDRFKLDRIVFDSALLRKNNGNFEVHLSHNQKKQRVFFRFNIDASISALVANGNIKMGKVITTSNSSTTSLYIDKTMQIPVLPHIIDEYAATALESGANGEMIKFARG